MGAPAWRQRRPARAHCTCHGAGPARRAAAPRRRAAFGRFPCPHCILESGTTAFRLGAGAHPQWLVGRAAGSARRAARGAAWGGAGARARADPAGHHVLTLVALVGAPCARVCVPVGFFLGAAQASGRARARTRLWRAAPWRSSSTATRTRCSASRAASARRRASSSSLAAAPRVRADVNAAWRGPAGWRLRGGAAVAAAWHGGRPWLWRGYAHVLAQRRARRGAVVCARCPHRLAARRRPVAAHSCLAPGAVRLGLQPAPAASGHHLHLLSVSRRDIAFHPWAFVRYVSIA